MKVKSKPKSVPAVYIAPALKARLVAHCEPRGIKLTHFASDAIRIALDKEKK